MLCPESSEQCFICRKSYNGTEDDHDPIHPQLGNDIRFLKKISLRNIYRYLRVNVPLTGSLAECSVAQPEYKQRHFSSPFLSPAHLKDLTVSACYRCSDVCNQLSTLYHELQVLQLRLNHAVETLHSVMEGADKEQDWELKLEGTQLRNTLWEETKQKCEAKLSNFPGYFAQVTVEKLVERPQLPQVKLEVNDESKVMEEPDPTYEPLSASEDDSLDIDEVPGIFPPLPHTTVERGEADSSKLNSTIPPGLKLHRLPNGRFSCRWCDKTQSKPMSYRSHIIFQHPEQFFPDMQFDSISNDDYRLLCRYVIADAKNETETPRGSDFQCIHCHKLCPPSHDRIGLFRHLVMHHLPQLSEQVQVVQKEVEDGQSMEYFRESRKGACKRRRKTGSGTKEQDSWKCIVCEKTFLTARKLRRHQRAKGHSKPDAETKWTCPKCHLTLQSKALVGRHIRIKNCLDEKLPASLVALIENKSEKNGKFDCSFCGKEGFYILRKLQQHVILYHPEQLFLTEKPDGMNEGIWREHSQMVFEEVRTSAKRIDVPGLPPGPKIKKRTLCPHCSQIATDINELRYHVVLRHADILIGRLRSLCRGNDTSPKATTPHHSSQFVQTKYEHDLEQEGMMEDNYIGGEGILERQLFKEEYPLRI